MTSEDESSALLSCDEEMHEIVAHEEQPIEEGTWVKVTFLYDRGVEKSFVGKVLSVIIPGEKYLGTFLRQSTKVPNIYMFPNVADEFEFQHPQVMKVLKPPTIRRGRHKFLDLS